MSCILLRLRTIDWKRYDMKKVSLELQTKIVSAYLDGISYKHIQDIFKVSRWNIQDALSKFDIKTDRIKSPPRLPGGFKRKGTLMERYHDGDFIPKSPKPIYIYAKPVEKPYLRGIEHNVVIIDDLDFQERYDLEGTEESETKYLEIDISENDEVRYIEK